MKTEVDTKQAPAAIGPYSQGITYKDLVFVSGQLPIDPDTMAFPEGGIREQTFQSLRNLEHVLKAGGASIYTVIKTTCFITDIKYFSEFNRVYQEFFHEDEAPARSCIVCLALPKNALIEIEAVAFKR